MTLYSDFQFDGMPRFGFGWENPNHAAAVLACLIPLCWAGEQACARHPARSRWRPACWAVEIVLCIMVGLTFSRGAVMGWVAAMMAYGLGRVWWDAAGRRDTLLRFWLPRCAVLLGVLAGTGLFRRFAIVAEGDGSAVNRLSLWAGGLKLINSSPWVGWGKGNSGLAFMQWVQEPSSTVVHGGMVNSYLHFVVEFGIPLFCAALAVLLFPICVGLRGPGAMTPLKRDLFQGAVSGLAAFAVAALFSTLWLLPSVIWMPGLLFAACLYCIEDLVSARACASAAAVALGISLVIAGGLGVASAIAAAGDVWKLRHIGDGAVRLVARRGGVSPVPDLVILPDHRTLGRYYGRELRNSLSFLPPGSISNVVVLPVGSAPTARVEGRCVVAFGPRWREAEKTGTKLVYVLPVGAPSENSAGAPEVTILPEYDELGDAEAWARWLDASHSKRVTLAGAGQDVRRDLPFLLPLIAEIRLP